MSNSLDSDQDRQNVGPDLGRTVCKGYQQTTEVAAYRERVEILGRYESELVANPEGRSSSDMAQFSSY